MCIDYYIIHINFYIEYIFDLIKLIYQQTKTISPTNEVQICKYSSNKYTFLYIFFFFYTKILMIIILENECIIIAINNK